MAEMLGAIATVKTAACYSFCRVAEPGPDGKAPAFVRHYNSSDSHRFRIADRDAYTGSGRTGSI